MYRIAFCGLAVALTPAVTLAQFVAPGFIPANPAPNSPFGPLTPYRNTPYLGVNTRSIYGNITIGQPIPFNNPLNRITNAPFYNWTAPPQYAPPPLVPWATGSPANRVSHGYMSGGASNTNVLLHAQREMDRAQRDAGDRARAGAVAAKNAIDEEWNYEKGALALPGGLKAVTDRPDELVRALAVADEYELVSGQALNQILAAVVAAEGKGAKGPSAFLTPQLISEVRFTGPPAADAVNFLITGSKLNFPAAFDDPRLKDAREELDRDFATVAAVLRDGKLPEQGRVMQLGLALQRLGDLAAPVIRDLPFDEAIAARRFLNRLQVALTAFKAPNSFLMFNPAWTSEGGSIGELVKHMAKFKLQFGPVSADSSESYAALHKGLSTYLFVLTQPKK
jgi:hypothetical protein